MNYLWLDGRHIPPSSTGGNSLSCQFYTGNNSSSMFNRSQRCYNIPETLNFDGYSNWPNFAKKFTRFAISQAWSDQECKEQLFFCLKGYAVDVHRIILLRNGNLTCFELMTKLEQCFGRAEMSQAWAVHPFLNRSSPTQRITIDPRPNEIAPAATKTQAENPKSQKVTSSNTQVCLEEIDKLLDEQCRQLTDICRPISPERTHRSRPIIPNAETPVSNVIPEKLTCDLVHERSAMDESKLEFDKPCIPSLPSDSAVRMSEDKTSTTNGSDRRGAIASFETAKGSNGFTNTDLYGDVTNITTPRSDQKYQDTVATGVIPRIDSIDSAKTKQTCVLATTCIHSNHLDYIGQLNLKTQSQQVTKLSDLRSQELQEKLPKVEEVPEFNAFGNSVMNWLRSITNSQTRLLFRGLSTLVVTEYTAGEYSISDSFFEQQKEKPPRLKLVELNRSTIDKWSEVPVHYLAVPVNLKKQLFREEMNLFIAELIKQCVRFFKDKLSLTLHSVPVNVNADLFIDNLLTINDVFDARYESEVTNSNLATPLTISRCNIYNHLTGFTSGSLNISDSLFERSVMEISLVDVIRFALEAYRSFREIVKAIYLETLRSDQKKILGCGNAVLTMGLYDIVSLPLHDIECPVIPRSNSTVANLNYYTICRRSLLRIREYLARIKCYFSSSGKKMQSFLRNKGTKFKLKMSSILRC